MEHPGGTRSRLALAQQENPGVAGQNHHRQGLERPGARALFPLARFHTWPRKRCRAGGVIDRELINQGTVTGLVSTAAAEAVIVPLKTATALPMWPLPATFAIIAVGNLWLLITRPLFTKVIPGTMEKP